MSFEYRNVPDVSVGTGGLRIVSCLLYGELADPGVSRAKPIIFLDFDFYGSVFKRTPNRVPKKQIFPVCIASFGPIVKVADCLLFGVWVCFLGVLP